MNGAPANPISGTSSSFRSSRIASSTCGHVRLRLERSQPRHVGGGADGVVHDGPHAGLDPDGDAHRRERHHDVAEQDRRVDRHPAERLQRDLDDQVRLCRQVSRMSRPRASRYSGR